MPAFRQFAFYSNLMRFRALGLPPADVAGWAAGGAFSTGRIPPVSCARRERSPGFRGADCRSTDAHLCVGTGQAMNTPASRRRPTSRRVRTLGCV